MLLSRFPCHAGAGLAAAVLAACAGVPSDSGRDAVRGLAAERGLEVAGPADEENHDLVDELLSEPLDAQDAVAIALLQSPRLRLAYAELDFAAADVYEAGRLSNPRLSAAWLDSDDPAATADQVTFGLAQSFTDLLLLRARGRLARGEFQRAEQLAAGEIIDLAADVQAAWFELAGAEQIAVMRTAIVEATGASAELAQRFFEAGNITHLELALERAAASEARLALLDARGRIELKRAHFNRLLALPAEADYEIVSGLPEPPPTEHAVAALIERAFDTRLDLAAQRRDVELLADNLGVNRRYRWLGALGDVEVGAERERETDGATLRGPTLELELPVFNQNADSVTRAEARLAIAEAELRALELEIGNAVRLAHAQMQTARERLREHAEALVPLREEIVARTQEQVNFMLMGPFELLRARRQEYDAYQGYLEAVRDYWLARAELGRAVGRTLSAGTEPGIIGAETLTAPASAPTGMDEHTQHGEPSAHTQQGDQK
ncbi:MAG TPA: TolC family protein [Gammaproteobacteria bacterium]|nr:TolC family protein [Gammaproteobacteria bacterium]